ncbi:MAG: hypothetical protein U0527_08075 [Candidatus Eisenbacteria bacterium]
MDEDPDWCPTDPRLLVFTHHALTLDDARTRGSLQLWLLNVETKEKRYITVGSMPSWAPSGAEIACLRDTGRGGNQIWAIDPKTGADRALTSGEAVRAYPDWSPDGSRISYESSGNAGDEPAGLWLLDLARGSRQPIRSWGHAPVWGPDGLRLATFGPGMYTFRVDPPDSLQTLIDAPPYVVGDGEWSPLGDEIAFHHLPDETHRYVSLINVESRKITTLIPWARQPTWSPDGTQLAFAAFDSISNAGVIYRWDRATADCERLTFVCDYYPPDSCFKFCEVVPDECEWAHDLGR